MIATKTNNYDRVSDGLKDGIYLIELMMQNRGRKVSLKRVRQDNEGGIAILFDGVMSQDDLKQAYLQFKDDYCDCNDYPAQVFANEKQTEMYLQPNRYFYLTK